MLITWRFKETQTQEQAFRQETVRLTAWQTRRHVAGTQRELNSVRERDTGRLTERQALGRETKRYSHTEGQTARRAGCCCYQ